MITYKYNYLARKMARLCYIVIKFFKQLEVVNIAKTHVMSSIR